MDKDKAILEAGFCFNKKEIIQHIGRPSNFLFSPLQDIFSEDEFQELSSSETKSERLMEIIDKNENEEKLLYFHQVALHHKQEVVAAYLMCELTDEKHSMRTFVNKLIRGHLDLIQETVRITDETLHQLELYDCISEEDINPLINVRINKGGYQVFLELFMKMTSTKLNFFPDFLYVLFLEESEFVLRFDDDLWKCLQPFLKDRKASKDVIEKYFRKYCEINIDCTSSTIEEKVIPPDPPVDCVFKGIGRDLEEFLDEHQSTRLPVLNEFKLYDYQEELAKPGLDEKNVIVCAPTGSGKTHVAVKIAMDHLEKPPKGRQRVAFLVHRVNLAEQQGELFKRYLKPKYRVEFMSGAAGDGVSATPLSYKLKHCDVIVMTAAILSNSLRSKESLKVSISDFSMLIFDECHNCDKGHPYNQVMVHYFSSSKSRRPQIVGLTASPGTDKAKKDEDAQSHLIKLMANMDCFEFKTVQEAIWDLQNRNTVPIDDFREAEPRESDTVNDGIHNLMGKCEQYLTFCYENGYFYREDGAIKKAVCAPEDRGSQPYGNFVGQLQILKNETKDTPDNLCRNSVYAIYRYLDVYNRALLINRLFRTRDAVDFIKRKLIDDSQRTCPLEEQLAKDLADQNLQDANITNPSLEILKEVVTGQLEGFVDSRIIIFVKQRMDTEILVQYFRDEPALEGIKADLIVGAAASSDIGGSTQAWQREVLAKFRDGENKVLISTTVAEEGLDVVKCNLVIRYAHVTNETAMIQSKGRARAKDSKYVLIIPAGMNWQFEKELTNKDREKMMFRAIDWLDGLTQEEKVALIKGKQENAEQGRLASDQARLDKVTENEGRVFQLWCKKCSEYVFLSSDFRLASGMHHFMINEEKLRVLKVEWPPNEKYVTGRNYKEDGKILCNKCNQEWGTRAFFNKVAFPVLAIKNFTVVDPNPEMHYKKNLKKWKDAPFNVPEITNDEIRERRRRIGADWLNSR